MPRSSTKIRTGTSLSIVPEGSSSSPMASPTTTAAAAAPVEDLPAVVSSAAAAGVAGLATKFGAIRSFDGVDKLHVVLIALLVIVVGLVLVHGFAPHLLGWFKATPPARKKVTIAPEVEIDSEVQGEQEDFSDEPECTDGTCKLHEPEHP